MEVALVIKIVVLLVISGGNFAKFVRFFSKGSLFDGKTDKRNIFEYF